MLEVRWPEVKDLSKNAEKLVRKMTSHFAHKISLAARG